MFDVINQTFTMKRKFNKTSLFLILALVFYFVGICFIKPNDIESLKKRGIAQQEEYYYEDEFGDEYEGETLVEIKGIGKILTYNDIYYAAIPMCIISLVMGMIFFGKEKYQNAIIANGVLGLLLIWITSKGTIVSTILYWLSLVSLHLVIKTDKKDNK